MESCVPQIPLALATPSLNRGVAFTHPERPRLGLTGRLPSGVLTLDQQAARVWQQLQSIPTNLGRNLLLDQLHNAVTRTHLAVIPKHPYVATCTRRMGT
jgi:malate dehydrogenase (oxaloacetate-decarboxylating)